MRSAFFGSILLVFVLGCYGCEGENGTSTEAEESFAFGGAAQGTSYLVKYSGTDLRDFQQSVDSIFEVIDESLSTYRETSTILRFNRQDELVTNDEHFIRMVFESKDIRDISEGAFDPTVMPLVRAWGFGPEGPQLEEEVDVDSLLQLVDWDFEVKISNQSNGGNHRSTTLEIVKNKPVEFDFNAIAKGYTVDVIFEYLATQGAENILVEVGGEVRARGVNEKGNVWLVGVDHPDEHSARGSQAHLKLENSAVATSGNYRKFYEKDGRKYSHTIDPQTGYPVSHQLLSATVVAPTCAWADAFATVFMVYGPEKSIAFLESEKGDRMEAYLIYNNDSGDLETYTTEGLKDLLTELPAPGDDQEEAEEAI